MKQHEHILHLKRHRNILYTIVIVLLVIQIVSYGFISTQIIKLNAQQALISNDLQSSTQELGQKITSAKQENNFAIQEISRELTEQRTDIEGQINLLKLSQQDFSLIIDDVIQGVVTVSTDKSTASGFIITDGGYIVTNYHVIEGAQFIKVNTYKGDSYDAVFVGSDVQADIALLRIPGSFNSLPLANSDQVEIGQKVIAIGNPLGLSFTVTEGIVSAVDRQGPSGLNAYIQTDVTLNPGNSGGPLINQQGQVIGINNFKIGGAESLGFALESNIIKEKVNEISISVLV